MFLAIIHNSISLITLTAYVIADQYFITHACMHSFKIYIQKLLNMKLKLTPLNLNFFPTFMYETNK